MPEAAIGRIVRWVGPSGREHPAQIVDIHDQASGPPMLNLVATLDGSNHSQDGGASDVLHVWATSIPHADPLPEGTHSAPGTQFQPHTWHWPPGI